MENEKRILAEFIECYKSNRVLWDSTSAEYLNKAIRQSGYNELLQILKKIKSDAKVDDVKKKINTLRSSFRKELKKVKQSEASGADFENIYTPSLWWFDYMRFLEHLEKPVESISTKRETKNTCSRVQQEEEGFKDEELFSPTKAKKIKPKRDEMPSMSFEYLAPGNDMFDYLAKTWASKLRTIPNVQRLLAEKAINDVLFEAEMGTLTRNSVKINDSSYSPSPSSINM